MLIVGATRNCACFILIFAVSAQHALYVYTSICTCMCVYDVRAGLGTNRAVRITVTQSVTSQVGRPFNETNLSLYNFIEVKRAKSQSQKVLVALEALRFPIRWVFK